MDSFCSHHRPLSLKGLHAIIQSRRRTRVPKQEAIHTEQCGTVSRSDHAVTQLPPAAAQIMMMKKYLLVAFDL